jgi:hypothetical protein
VGGQSEPAAGPVKASGPSLSLSQGCCPGLILAACGWVDPVNLLRLLNRVHIGDVHHDGFVVAAHQHAFEGLVGTGVDLLMGDKGRHIDEVSGSGLSDELQPLAPAHTSLAPHHIDDALQFAVMVHPGLGVRLDRNRARPDLLGSHPGMIDRGLAKHARGLGRVRIEAVALDHLDAVVLPVLVRIVATVMVVVCHGALRDGLAFCACGDHEQGAEGEEARFRAPVRRFTARRTYAPSR